jgi:hypothetical protein
MSGGNFSAPPIPKIFSVSNPRYGGIFVPFKSPQIFTVFAEIHEYRILTKVLYFSIKIMTVV